MSRVFLGIGAQKAGTSWLHRCLRAHPDVWLPPVKELHFFNERSKLGEDRLPRRIATRRARVELREFVAHVLRNRDPGALAWGLRYFFSTRDIDWYRSVLARRGAGLVGDITPAYSLLDDDAVARVAGELPDVRAVLLLRDPVERAYSHAMMDLAQSTGRDPGDIAASEFFDHFGSMESTRRTAYSEMIERWGRILGAERLHVGFYDEIAEQPVRLLERIAAFLQLRPVDWAALAPVAERVNVGRRSAMPEEFRAALARRYRGEIESLREMVGGRYVEAWLRRA